MLRFRLTYILFTLFFLGACSKNEAAKVDDNQDTDSTDTTYVEEPKLDMKITLADPTIFYDSDSDMYYLYGTSGSEVVHTGFKVFSSKDLVNWMPHKKLALTKGDVYGSDDFWAPQVFKYGSKYYMAYAANEHIAIAESDSPLGPFKQANKTPISDPDGVGTIDPYVLIDGSNKYLYYVRFKGGNTLYVADLNNDLTDINPATVTFCMSGTIQPQSWENVDHSTAITEGPTVIKHEGTYYFFYSANNYQSPDYAVGYATANDPMGAWTKYGDNPILNRALIGEDGPGHGDFFQDKNGDYYYVFHTHYSLYEVQPRLTGIIKGKFVSNGSGPDIFKFDKDSFRYLTIKQD